jgi:hypothetical protein
MEKIKRFLWLGWPLVILAFFVTACVMEYRGYEKSAQSAADTTAILFIIWIVTNYARWKKKWFGAKPPPP